MTNKLVKACVMGWPAKHSLSPFIHHHWITRYDLRGAYDIREIAPEDLRDSVRKLVDEGYAGFNVTIPHKQAIMDLCDEIDEAAQKIGAVNTVRISAGGKLYGMNTDSFGFAENLRCAGVSENVKGAPVLVLGAGGAARGIVHALLGLGAGTVKTANRTMEKAQGIARTFPVMPVAWERREEEAEGAALLVNTTALGMDGQEPLLFDLRFLPKEAVVCDIVYRPLVTPLLKQAQDKGLKTVTGIGMLLHQARPAFREWFGILPDVDEELEREIIKRAGGSL